MLPHMRSCAAVPRLLGAGWFGLVFAACRVGSHACCVWRACSHEVPPRRTRSSMQAAVLPSLGASADSFPDQNFNWTWSRQRFADFPPASLPLDEAAGTTTHFTATVSSRSCCQAAQAARACAPADLEAGCRAVARSLHARCSRCSMACPRRAAAAAQRSASALCCPPGVGGERASGVRCNALPWRRGLHCVVSCMLRTLQLRS